MLLYPLVIFSNEKNTIIHVSNNTIFINKCDSSKLLFNSNAKFNKPNAILHINEGTIFVDINKTESYFVVKINKKSIKRNKCLTNINLNKNRLKKNYITKCYPISKSYPFKIFRNNEILFITINTQLKIGGDFSQFVTFIKKQSNFYNYFTNKFIKAPQKLNKLITILNRLAIRPPPCIYILNN